MKPSNVCSYFSHEWNKMAQIECHVVRDNHHWTDCSSDCPDQRGHAQKELIGGLPGSNKNVCFNNCNSLTRARLTFIGLTSNQQNSAKYAH